MIVYFQNIDPAVTGGYSSKSQLSYHHALDTVRMMDLGLISLGDAADALNAACYTIEGKPDDTYISALAIGVDSAVGLRYAKYRKN